MTDGATVLTEIAASLKRMFEMTCEIHERCAVTQEMITQSRDFMVLADERMKPWSDGRKVPG